MNKTQSILSYMKKNGSITSWDAIQRFGDTRLSSKIFNLKKRGHNIVTLIEENTDSDGNTSRYARYIYKGEE